MYRMSGCLFYFHFHPHKVRKCAKPEALRSSVKIPDLRETNTSSYQRWIGIVCTILSVYR